MPYQPSFGRRIPRLVPHLVSLAVTLAAGPALRAVDLTLTAGTYRVAGQARHDHYTVTAALAPASGQSSFAAVDLVFAYVSPTDYTRFRWDAQGFALERTADGTTAVLRRGTTPLLASLAHGGALEIRTRPTVVEVVGPEGRVCRVLNPGLGRGQVAVRTGAALAEVATYSYQRVEPITFGDDFMRTEEEGADLGLWQPGSGHWRLYSVMERIQANPDARIREGREPDASRSPNPFCLSGTGTEGALILTGQAFWSDYEAAVSVRSFQSDFGLVFSARDADNCWLVRWGLHSLGLRPARLELVQRRHGQDRVVAATTVTGRAEAWYRLAARLFGDSITVLVDDVPVLAHRNAACAGGRVGLYARGEEETYFDDVTVNSVSALDLDDPDLVGGDALRPLAGNWEVAAGDTGCRFTGSGVRARGDAALALCALGWEGWPAQCVETTVEVSPGAVFGLAFGVAGTERHLRVLWSRQDGGRVSVFAVTEGDAEEIAKAPCPLPESGPVTLCVDARDGILRVRADGVTRLRLRPAADLTGPVGLVVRGRTPVTFSACRLFATPREDWEAPVIVERFADDPYMQGWASTRFVWLRLDPDAGRAEFPQRFVHNGDFYGPFRVTAPVQDRLAFFFGLDEVAPGKGYCVETRVDAARQEGIITLARERRTLAQAAFVPGPRQILPGQQIVDEKIGARPRTPDTESYGTLELQRDGQVVWASIEGKELFCVVDPQPLTGRALGMQVPAPMDFIHVAARRAQIKDDLFERAAVDWLPVGDWEVTNRFACDPRWSHMNGGSKGVAALWSKFAFEGDFTVEYYAGMRMRQEEMMEGADRMYYPRVGDINVALAAQASDLFSGYNLLVTAWDPMWTETSTQLRRLSEVMASTDTEMIPRGRHRAPKTRAIQVDWDPGGRPVHGAWYFVKLRRTGPRLEAWFDHVPVFSVTDSDPLAGQRLALWTQHNSIVIARAKISYRNCRKVVEAGVPLRAERPPAARAPEGRAPRLCSPTHPGRYLDFEGSVQGVTPWHGDQSAELALEPRGEDGTALRLENLHGGGDAGVRLPLCGVDLGRDCVLEMDVAAEPGARVNLYLAFEDSPAERCFVPLTGPREEGPNQVRLGPDDGVPANGQWQHVRWDLGDWARRRFPWRSSFRVAFLMVGMLHEGYLNAGLGGNPAGAVYRLDTVRLLSDGGAEVAVECHTETPDRLRWRAWLSREPEGAVPVGSPDLTAPCLALHADAPGDWFIQGEWLDGDITRRLRPLPIRVGVPLAVTRTVPAPNTPWGGDRIHLAFAESAGHPELAHARLRVAGCEVPVNETTATYDPATRALDLRVLYGGEARPDGAAVEIRFEATDTLAGSPSVGADGRVGDPPADLVHTWQAVLDYGADRSGPHVELTGDPARRVTCNTGLGSVALLAPPDECRLSLTPGPDGTPALQLANHVCGSTFNVNLGLPSFPLGRYPRLDFDYRVDAYAQCDFMFRLLGQQLTLGFTDADDSTGVLLGSVDGVVRDDAWRHASVDLTALRPRATRRSFMQPGNVSEVGFGDWVYPSNAPGARVALDNLEFVPAVGTAAGPLELTWAAHDLSGIKGYSYAWDTAPGTEPDTTAETAEGKARFAALPAGECYFHLRAGDNAGNWGAAVHYRFLVDNDPPVSTEVEPADGTTAAADRLRVRFGPSLAGLDPSALALTINGKAYQARPGTGGGWDALTSEFTYDLLADWSLLRGSVPDGSTMAVSLTQVKDFAGNAMAPLSWSWKVDYAKDKTGPLPPRLWGYGHSFENYDSFSEGVGAYWRAYGGDGTDTDVSGVALPEVGPCLQIRKLGTAMRFAAYRSVGQLNLKSTPLLTFDYCLSPGTRVNLLIYLNKEWHQVTMTGSDRLPALGQVPEARADGQWRQASVDLAQRVKEKFPDREDPEIRLIAFGEWGVANPEGSTLWLDNVALLGPACPLPLARYSAADATGIRAYRLGFSRERREAPALETTVRDTPVLLSAADAPGMWYIHAQAQDGAGNWGDVLHYPYFCTAPVALYAEDGFEAGGGWRVIPGHRTSQGYVYQAKGSGSNQVLGVQLIMQGSCDMEISRSVGMVLPLDTAIEADLYIQAEGPLSLAACVRPAGGNGVLITGERQELAPGTWHRNVALRFAPGALVKGAPGQGKPLRARDLGIVATPKRAARNVILIDHLKVNGKLAAG